MNPKLFLGDTYPSDSCSEVLQTFLREKQNVVSKHTLARIYYNLNSLMGKKPIRHLDAEWVNQHIERCWLRYAPETMRVLIGDVREFFKWCQTAGYLTENIAEKVKPIGQKQRRNRRAKAAPERDIQQVMEYLANQVKQIAYKDLFGNLTTEITEWSTSTIKALRDLFILTFLYETGARVGELCKLGSRAMSETTNEVKPVYPITVIGKTHDRDYLFTQKTAELWLLWNQVRPVDYQEYAIIGWGKGHQPGPMLPNGVSNMLVRRCREARVKPFRTHSLRHAKIKRSRTLVGLEMASLLVDHSSIETTLKYDSLNEEKLIEAAAMTGLQINLWK